MPNSLQSGRGYEQRLQTANTSISGKPFTRAAYEKALSVGFASDHFIQQQPKKKNPRASLHISAVLLLLIARRIIPHIPRLCYVQRNMRKYVHGVMLRLTHLMSDLYSRRLRKPATSPEGTRGNEEQGARTRMSWITAMNIFLPSHPHYLYTL